MSLYPNVEEISINRCVPYYLMSSYLYYKQDKSVLHDNDYDSLCKRIIKEWDSITHIHKHFISKESLEAGTGYSNQYTNRIVGAACTWYKDYEKEIS
tara:strand:+ start:7249 stop:7539 length:291 start_codon:yes stop_codon:yes gene_type:complete